MGTYQQNFWGEHSNILAYYASKEEALKEIEEIQKALESAESIYELDYYRNIKSLGIDIELDD